MKSVRKHLLGLPKNIMKPARIINLNPRKNTQTHAKENQRKLTSLISLYSGINLKPLKKQKSNLRKR